MILPLVATFLLTFCTGQLNNVYDLCLVLSHFLPLWTLLLLLILTSTSPGALAEGLQMRAYKGVDNQVTY